MNLEAHHAPRPGVRRAAAALAAAATVVLVAVPGGSASAAVPTGAPTRAAAATTAARPVPYSSGRPRYARLTIPAIGVRRVPVIPYRGKTDDGPGTRIQNRGILASPYGRQGGIGPGGIGNYQVTGHRSSHGAVFSKVPSLRRGARVYVDTGRWRYVYRVFTTRWVSFRSAASLRAQRAEVPGHPGRTATRGYITVSTCATPEDHANGNYWTDRYGNPEHRIDKIGILIRRVPNPYRSR